METSAKTGMNVDLAFMAVAKYVKMICDNTTLNSIRYINIYKTV